MADTTPTLSHVEIPTDGTQLIRDGLSTYGRRVLRDHFPQAVDGLKAIYRRAIWVARHFPDTGRSSTAAVGEIKVLHDHGPEAIYKTLARMAQPFQYAPPLMTLHGSAGSYMNNSPAADRYTSISLHPFARDVFFRGIETSALPMMQGMDLQQVEPQYLAPALPLALTLGNTTVGFGFASRTPSRNLGDICDLVEALCQHLAKGGEFHTFDLRKHADKLLPDFALENVIINQDALLTAYRQGNFEHHIELEGAATLTKNTIEVYTLPVGTSFDVVERVRQAIESAKSKKASSMLTRWIEQHISDVTEEPDRVVIQLKKTAPTVFEAWERISRLIGFANNLHPNPNYVNEDGTVHQLSPLQVLEVWYHKRHDLLLSSKRRQLRQLFERLRVLEALLIVSKHTKQVLALLEAANTVPEAVAALTTTFKLTRFQAEHLARAPISIIIKASKEDLQQQYDEQLARVAALQRSFQEIPQEIAATARELKRRYGQARTTRLPAYAGYAAVQGGCIQFESVADVEEILRNFPNTPLQVHSYDGATRLHLDGQGKVRYGTQSKHTTGDLYGLSFAPEQGWTVNIREDGATCAVKGLVPGRRRDGYFYTTRKSWLVRRDGRLAIEDIAKVLSVRKSISRGAISDVIYVYPQIKQPHYLLFACDQDKNVLVLQRITPETVRAVFPPAGNIYTLHHRTGKDWYFSLPSEYLNRLAARAFVISDAEALLGTDSLVRLELGQARWKRHSVLRVLT